jgi:hypothetical protein
MVTQKDKPAAPVQDGRTTATANGLTLQPDRDDMASDSRNATAK